MGSHVYKCGDILYRILYWALSTAVALLVLDVTWGVFTRFLMDGQATWTEELARYLLIWVSLLGAAVAFRTKSHLGIDLFVNALAKEPRKWMNILAQVVVLFFAVSIFLFGGYSLVSDTFAMEQMTPALGWKMGYVYLAVPVSGVFMVIFTLENILDILSDKECEGEGL
jgi:TRAP-type C4-dicarboxylate transport system permease small subunit